MLVFNMSSLPGHSAPRPTPSLGLFWLPPVSRPLQRTPLPSPFRLTPSLSPLRIRMGELRRSSPLIPLTTKRTMDL